MTEPAKIRNAADTSGSRSARVATVLEEAGMLLVLALLLIGCSVFVDNFATSANVKGMLYSVSFIGMVSCTMLFCLASGNFDLSVGRFCRARAWFVRW